MSNIQFALMAGSPINLEKYKLGTIYQPKLKYFVNSNIDIANFSHPFIFEKEMFTSRNESSEELRKCGKLDFFFIYDEAMKLSNEPTDRCLVPMLVEALKMLYKTEDIFIHHEIKTITINNTIWINNDTLSILSDIVLEIMRIDKKIRQQFAKAIRQSQEQEKESNTYEDKLLQEIERRAREHEENLKAHGKKSNKEATLLDMANVVIHMQDKISYRDVMDMTIYQLKNSYETLMTKEISNINLYHRISPNFQVKDDLKIWQNNSRLKDSNLNI